MVRQLTEYIVSLKHDLIEQFKGKPNTEALADALAKQLQEVYDFYLQLMTVLSIDECEGVQLDNIGDIVQLTRAEAKALASNSEFSYENEDQMYRAFLYYKIFLNTADCTYEDVMNSIYMMWNGVLEYSEDPALPATILLAYQMFNGDDHGKLMDIPILKPGGVQVRFRAKGELTEDLKVGGGIVERIGTRYGMAGRACLPNYLTDENDYILCDENWNILCDNGDDE